MAEFGTRPSSSFSWNSSGTNRTTPSTATKAAGFSLRGAIVSGVFNYLFNLIGQWFSYLDTTSRAFDSIGAALASISDGEVATIVPMDTTKSPLDSTLNIAKVSNGAAAMALTGRWVVALEGSQVVVYDADDGSEADRATVTGTPYDVACDGSQVYIGVGTGELKCYAFNDDTGEVDVAGGSVWEYDHQAAIYTVECDGAYAYFGGVENASNKTHGRVECYGGSAGTADWTANHDATVRDCALGFNLVVFVGDDESGSGNTIEGRVHTRDSGTAIHNIRFSSSDLDLHAVAIRGNLIAVAGETGGDGVYYVGMIDESGIVVGGDGGKDEVYTHELYSGVTINCIAWIGDHLLVGHNDTNGKIDVCRIWATHYDGVTASGVRLSEWDDIIESEQKVLAMEFDGAHLWVAGDDGTNNYRRLYWPVGASVIKRQDVTTGTVHPAEHSARGYGIGRL